MELASNISEPAKDCYHFKDNFFSYPHISFPTETGMLLFFSSDAF
jgi:hypothetical protein